MNVILQPAFVLHSRAYRDTSCLVELFTMQHGRLTVVARGVRSIKSRFKGILIPFLPLLVSFRGKTNLYTLQHAEANSLSYELKEKTLWCGLYLNELLFKLLPIHEAYLNVYQAYKSTLAALTTSKLPEVELRLFEKCLLANLGYGLQLNYTKFDEPVLPDEYYAFEFGSGLTKVNFAIENPKIFSGKSLLALTTGNFTTCSELSDAKRLLRSVISVLLGSKPLKSRELFSR